MATPKPLKRRVCVFLCGLIFAATWPSLPDAEAQDGQPAETPPAAESAEKADTPTAMDELTARQSRVADRFARLESLMLKRAEIDNFTNPRRAKVLREAISTSKERHIRLQLTDEPLFLIFLR